MDIRQNKKLILLAAMIVMSLTTAAFAELGREAYRQLMRAKNEIRDLEDDLIQSRQKMDKVTMSLYRMKDQEDEAGYRYLKNEEDELLERITYLKKTINEKKNVYVFLKRKLESQDKEGVSSSKEEKAGKIKEKAASTNESEGSDVILHTVREGETLMSISREYFETSSLFEEIAKTNDMDFREPIEPGKKLKIDMRLKEKISPFEGL